MMRVGPFQFSKPRAVLSVVMVLLVVGFVLVNAGHRFPVILEQLALRSDPMWVLTHPWALLTSPFLTGDAIGVLFHLMILFGVGVDLEARWGTSRMVMFFALSVLISSAAVVLTSFVGPPVILMGLSPFISALFVAYLRTYKHRQMSFFGVLPLSANQMLALVVVFSGVQLFSAWQLGVASLAAMAFAWLLVDGLFRKVTASARAGRARRARKVDLSKRQKANGMYVVPPLDPSDPKNIQ